MKEYSNRPKLVLFVGENDYIGTLSHFLDFQDFLRKETRGENVVVGITKYHPDDFNRSLEYYSCVVADSNKLQKTLTNGNGHSTTVFNLEQLKKDHDDNLTKINKMILAHVMQDKTQ